MGKTEGVYDSKTLIDSLISDCNDAVGAVAQGKYILWCRTMYEMVQKLALLKNGIADDLKGKDETIASLKEQLAEAGIEVTDIPVEELTDGNKTTCQESQSVVK